jgi:formyltetrahydrofolate-dependent phosphoribosylglycinamide formyltransferase
MGKNKKVAILIGKTGRGSNMKNLVRFCQQHDIGAEIALVVSPVVNEATSWAKNHNIPVIIVEKKNNTEYGSELLQALQHIDIICLAGYLYLLPIEVVEQFQKRILNIHPSLLPKFGGKGMYGLNVHKAVIEAGETESGCTVHIVTPEYDDGEIILQVRCKVLATDTPEKLAERVLVLEHAAYPIALEWLCLQLYR